jgi:hypothetical protein
MKTKLMSVSIALFFLLALPAGAQNSAYDRNPPTSGAPETAPAGSAEQASAPSRPLSGGRLQADGPQVMASGVITPSFMLSEMATRSGTNTDYWTSISGSLAYHQLAARHSFSLQYDGGGLFHSSNWRQDSNFQSLSLTQSFAARRWSFLLGDKISYLPQAPIGPGIGIPGLGEFAPGLAFNDLNPNLLPSQSILMFNATALNNSSFGQAQYNFTRQTSVTAVGSYGLLRYLDDSVLSGHQVVATTGLNHEMRHSQVAVQYSYSRFDYDAITGGSETHAAQLMYSRVLARDFSAQIGAGPEIVHLRGFAAGNSIVGSGLVSVSYARKHNNLTLQYSRGVNGGSGLLTGANSDTVRLTAARQYRSWSVSANGGYTTNSGITRHVRTISRTAGAQLTRVVYRTVGVYLSYTYLAQSAGSLCVSRTCAYNGDENVFGFGLYWRPRGVRVGK